MQQNWKNLLGEFLLGKKKIKLGHILKSNFPFRVYFAMVFNFKWNAMLRQKFENINFQKTQLLNCAYYNSWLYADTVLKWLKKFHVISLKYKYVVGQFHSLFGWIFPNWHHKSSITAMIMIVGHCQHNSFSTAKCFEYFYDMK